MAHYDHIIIGGGASGCVVAGTLVRRGARVLVLEAGYSHHHPLLDMPPGIFKMINGSKYMRYHKTPPQDHLNGRQHDIPQGHVLGGGSSVNAQVYMRGRPSDYDNWHKSIMGKKAQTSKRDTKNQIDWSWNAVLPYFRDMEGNNRFYNHYHGCNGPLLVSDSGHIDILSRLFVQSVQSLGEPYNADFNGATQRGVGFYQFMNRNGQRCSAAHAYLDDLKGNPNLTIKLQHEVQEIILDKNKAVGVRVKNKHGTIEDYHCDGDIVLSAGALITPKLLMLSGIGDPKELKDHNIPCKVALPGVGKNLVDHPEVPITSHSKGPHGYYKQGEGWRMLKNGLQFKLFGSGPINSVGTEAGAFVNPLKPDQDPTIQAFCVPIVYVDRDTRDLVKNDYGLTVTTVVTKPKSRGFVKLASNNPQDMPIVSPNLLGHKEDLKQMMAGQRFFIKAFQAEPLCDYLKGVVLPNLENLTDDALEAYCRRFVKTNYHPAGTAKMGSDDDPMAVLTPSMKVRGVDGLRVCDMSAAPDLMAGNTNAPAMMLGARCADFITSKTP